MFYKQSGRSYDFIEWGTERAFVSASVCDVAGEPGSAALAESLLLFCIAACKESSYSNFQLRIAIGKRFGDGSGFIGIGLTPDVQNNGVRYFTAIKVSPGSVLPDSRGGLLAFVERSFRVSSHDDLIR